MEKILEKFAKPVKVAYSDGCDQAYDDIRFTSKPIVFDKSNKSSSFKENNQKYTDKGYSDNDRNNPSQNVKNEDAEANSDEVVEEVEGGQKPEGENRDEYDEEEEEEEEDYHPVKKTKKKDRCGGFIIYGAEVDDDVETEDDDECDEELGIVANELEQYGLPAREIDNRQRSRHLRDGQDEQAIVEYLHNKCTDRSYLIDDSSNQGISDIIIQKTLLPVINGPNLWMLKCKIGKEKATAIQLMNKYFAYQNTNNPLEIKSVIAPEDIKGIIYIEAFKKAHVLTAIEDVSNLKFGQNKQIMVPLNEMTQVLRVVKDQVLCFGQWVRLKRTMFKGDIAQIDYVDPSQNKVYLKLLPRIDYTRFRGALRHCQKGQGNVKRKRNDRPIAKPFDPEAIRRIGGKIVTDGDYFVFERNRYSRKGFLYKYFPINAIVTEGVKPDLSELEKFEDTPESLVLDITEKVNTTNKGGVLDCFSPGDNVIVSEGELKNLEGKIISISGEMIMVMPNHKDLTKEALQFRASELKKHFKIGDHVRVLDGRFKGDTGIIVYIEENRVVLFSDLSMHELEVLPSNLQLYIGMATGLDTLSQFEWGDLVNLDPQTVGIIVRMERDCFHVLNMHGKVVKARRQALTKRQVSILAAALDTNQNTIKKRDFVKVIQGPNAGRSGEIKHVYRSFAFLNCRSYLENGGFIVSKTSDLQLEWREKVTAVGLGGGIKLPRISSPMHSSGDGGRNIGGRDGRGDRSGSDGVRRDRNIIGKTIKIIRGAFKGSVGIVKGIGETSIRVELHTPFQTIMVKRSHIVIIDDPTKKGAFTSNNTMSANGNSDQTTQYIDDLNKTPRNGSQTPMHDGFKTPMHDGSKTPMNDGSQIPNQSGAWDSTITNTPYLSTDCKSSYSLDHARSSSSSNYPRIPEHRAAAKKSLYTSQTSRNFNSYHRSTSSQTKATDSSGYLAAPNHSEYPRSGIKAAVIKSSSREFSHQTPGTECEHNLMTDWVAENIEVRIRESKEDAERFGAIVSVSQGMCNVFVHSEAQVVSVCTESIEPIKPKIKDRVKVIGGEFRGLIGTMVAIDNEAGVIKLNHIRKVYNMIHLNYLCVINR